VLVVNGASFQTDANNVVEDQVWRPGNFSTLHEALDHAARSRHGMTFFNGRGEVVCELSYRELRAQAMHAARRLLGLADVNRGDRVALVAETRSEFVILFFACQYAGLVPVPLPATVSLGGREQYLRQLRFLIENSGARAAFATEDFVGLLADATKGLGLALAGRLEDLIERPASKRKLVSTGVDEIAYVQYTSGSTRVARGAVITQRAVMCNLTAIISDGLGLGPDDRFFSWLPFYHDMGLVGKILVPVASQLPVAYLGTREFAMRPRMWLTLMDRTQATISFGPPFGYELCARRLRDGDGARFDLHRWRVAGVGAEMIRPEALESFVTAVAGSGFNGEAFVPSYGMAEVGLAISFARRDCGVGVDHVDRNDCVRHRRARPVSKLDQERVPVRAFVDCGAPLPGIDVEVRGRNDELLPEREIGTLWVRTKSVMQGYLQQPEATAEVLTSDGWLNTGDLGYLLDGRIFVTGREKDMIIVGGRNFWPQDLEYVAESQESVRTGDSMAFSISDDGGERVVLLIQSRELDPEARARLQHTVHAHIKTEFGIHCHVELVDAQALPRTSSGKPSRSQARRMYAESLEMAALASAAGGTSS
jgi:fatty-acyl-CoA synthase